MLLELNDSGIRPVADLSVTTSLVDCLISRIGALESDKAIAAARLAERDAEISRLQSALESSHRELTAQRNAFAREYGREERSRELADTLQRERDEARGVLRALWDDEQLVGPEVFLELGGEDATAGGEYESGWVRAARLLAANGVHASRDGATGDKRHVGIVGYQGHNETLQNAPAEAVGVLSTTPLESLERLRDWLVDDTLSMSDAEIEEEIRESGGDPAQVAAETRAVAMRAVADARARRQSAGLGEAVWIDPCSFDYSAIERDFQP